MKKTEKGKYGYRKYFRLKRGIGCGLMLAAILLLVILRTVTKGQPIVVAFTLSAVFMAIPFAIYLTPLAATIRWKDTPEAVHREYEAYEKDFPVLYDLFVTTKDTVLPVDVAIIHPTGVYLWCVNPKVDARKAEQALNERFTLARLDPNIHVFLDKKSFDKRIRALKPAAEFEDDGTLPYMVETLKQLTM